MINNTSKNSNEQLNHKSYQKMLSLIFVIKFKSIDKMLKTNFEI